MTDNKYIKLRHKHTGKEFVYDATNSRYDRIAKGYLNSLKMKPHFTKHIILTQAKESYKPKILNSFMQAMKKRYENLLYIWTVELQEKRFETTGEAVLHWHVMMSFPYETGLRFGREDIEKIQSYWKYGMMKCVPVKKMNLGYLMKYLKKDLAQDIGLTELFERVRRIGTSKIAPYMRQSYQSLLEMLSFFALSNISPDEFYWYRGSAYLYTDEKYKRGREYVYKRTSFWEVVGGWNEEAF